jgi:hypothetical protein
VSFLLQEPMPVENAEEAAMLKKSKRSELSIMS